MKAFLAILLTLAVTGCAFLDAVEPDTKQLAVQYATIKVIDGDTTKRDRVLELVERGRKYVTQDDSVTIAALDQGVRDLIRWDSMDAADRLLIDNIIINARERMADEIGSGLLNAEQKAKVLTVFDWIESAAGEGVE